MSLRPSGITSFCNVSRRNVRWCVILTCLVFNVKSSCLRVSRCLSVLSDVGCVVSVAFFGECTCSV